MVSLLIEILPLAIASAMSPVILGVCIAMLSKKAANSVLAFLLGSVLAAIILFAIGVAFASGDDIVAQEISQPVAIFDLALGLLLGAFGLKVLLMKESAGDRLGARGQLSAKKLVAVGLLGTLTNFDAALLNITAVRTIAETAGSFATKLLPLAVTEFFLLSPILLPLGVYLVAPQKSAKLLEPLGAWMGKYGRFVVGLIFLGFAVYLVAKALPALAG
ncbi:Sap, sulfolipid-1-addressing protein [Candidatus Burarchaeum australiense]|nr:Sap, sulfolipid-1-addressing protein [Candidatus Burarchaeum australiense]